MGNIQLLLSVSASPAFLLMNDSTLTHRSSFDLSQLCHGWMAANESPSCTRQPQDFWGVI